MICSFLLYYLLQNSIEVHIGRRRYILLKINEVFYRKIAVVAWRGGGTLGDSEKRCKEKTRKGRWGLYNFDLLLFLLFTCYPVNKKYLHVMLTLIRNQHKQDFLSLFEAISFSRYNFLIFGGIGTDDRHPSNFFFFVWRFLTSVQGK